MAAQSAMPIMQCPLLEGLSFIKGDPLDVPSSSGPVLLEVWATWCRVCPRGFPSTAQLQQRFGAQGLRVVAVSIEPDVGLVRRFLEQHDKEMQFAVAVDTQGEAAVLMRAVGCREVPYAFLIDSQGMVRAHSNPVRLSFKVEVGNRMRELSGQPISPTGQPPVTTRAQTGSGVSRQKQQPLGQSSASTAAAAARPPAPAAGAGGSAGGGTEGDSMLLVGGRVPSCDMEGHCA